MTNEELAGMYHDFERWMPGVFKYGGLIRDGITWMERGRAELVREESAYPVSALIECAVLDELERRNVSVEFTVDIDGTTPLVWTHDRRYPFWTSDGHGPTRLHRLHAACRAAFGTERSGG